jgi:hypothetical protein
VAFHVTEHIERRADQLLAMLQRQIAAYRRYRWKRQRCPHGMPGGLTRNLCAECSAEAEQRHRAEERRRAEELRRKRQAEEQERILAMQRQEEEKERQRLRDEEERKTRLRRKAARLQEEELAKARAVRLQRLDSLLAFTPRQFEEEVAQLYSRLGFQVELTPAVGDYGVDVMATRGGVLYAIECKKLAPDHPVSRPLVQKLHSAMHFKDATRGIFVTTSRFGGPARKFAKECGIELVDGSALCAMFERAFPVDNSAPHFRVMCTECGQILRFPILDNLLRAKCQQGHVVFCDSRLLRGGSENKSRSASGKSATTKKTKSGERNRRRRYRRR